MRETVRELGGERAGGFLRKFYGWYLGRGRFPRQFKQELVGLATPDEVEARLFAVAPDAIGVLSKLMESVEEADERLLELPISIYGGG